MTAEQAKQIASDFVKRGDRRRSHLALDFEQSTASSVELFLMGENFFPAMLKDIEEAQSSIHIVIFAMASDELGRRFESLLIKKAQQGLDVRIVTDRQGARPFTNHRDMFARLAAGGVQVVVNDTLPFQGSGVLPARKRSWRQDHVGRADHRKMLVIDGIIGWVGGAGFEDHFAHGFWIDEFARVKGNIVLQLQAVYCTSFYVYGGELPDDLSWYFPEQPDPGDIPVTVIQNTAGGAKHATHASRKVLEGARTRLDILNPYFTDSGMINRVVDAARRGADVRVATSQDSNNVPGAWAFRKHYQRMFDTGISVHEAPGVLHAKVTVADDKVILGSLNYDAWSLYRNLELSLLFEDAQIADRVVAEIIEPVLERTKVPDALESWREKATAQLWWLTRHFL